MATQGSSLRPVVPDLFSVMEPFEDLANSCGPVFFSLRHFGDFLLDMLRSESRVACVQNFALWQQAIIDITCCDHSIIACSYHLYIIWVLFFTHIPFVVNRTFSAMPTEGLQQHPLLFTMNRTDGTFFL